MDEFLQRIIDAALSPIPPAKIESGPRLSGAAQSAQELQEKQNDLDLSFLLREHYCALHGLAFALGKSGAVDVERFGADLLAGARAFSIRCGGANVTPPLAASLKQYMDAGNAARAAAMSAYAGPTAGNLNSRS